MSSGKVVRGGASMVAVGSAEDQKLISFGKHRGLTYSEVATNHAGYSAWAMKAASKGGSNHGDSSGMRDFVAYLGGSVGSAQGEELASLPAEPIKAAQLTKEQQRIVERVLSGENAFITGPAGTGKSFLLRFLIQELESRNPEQVAVTASTGIAAANIGGQTLHSFAGIGLGWGSAGKLVKQISKKESARQRWQQAKVLVVDEVSMIDGALFTKLEEIARLVRRSKAPFGGLQLLLCGDFLQLPPVHVTSRNSEVPKAAADFCFKSPAWQKCNLNQGVMELQELVRQASDPAFAAILGEVRLGKVSVETEQLLKSCHSSVKPAPDDDIIPTKLYCFNKDVDKENKAQLDKLSGDEVVFEAEDVFNTDVDKSEQKSMKDTLGKRIPKKMHLKVDAQVILIVNKPQYGLVNGSRGSVVAFQSETGDPMVRFDNNVLLRVKRETFDLQGSPGTFLKRSQVPLKLGWALTVHKAAGLTLSRAELKVDGAFEAGQAYVALSRLTGTKGLWISGRGIDPSKTRADPEALKFYERV